MAARSLHQVHDTRDAQPTPEFPIENWIDSLSGKRLRRTYLGRVYGGELVLGGIPRSCGVDLYFRRTQGNASKPRAGEIDLDLRKLIELCWQRQLRQSGKPILQRSGPLTWLTTLPLGNYHIERGSDASSALFKFTPIIIRPRGALNAVPLQPLKNAPLIPLL